MITRFSWKNDGGWHQSTPLDIAIRKAVLAWWESGAEDDWTTLLVTQLECDERDEHYPDLCYHYEIEIE